MRDDDAPNNIRALRKAKGWNGTKLGEMIGTDKTQVSKLERGERALTEDWLKRLSSALGCTIADILKVPAAASPDASRLPPCEDIDNAALEAAIREVSIGVRAGIVVAHTLDDKIKAVLRYYYEVVSQR